MEELKVKIVGVTSTDPEVIEAATKEKFELDGGHSANICYTQKSFDEIISEDESKTKDRAEGNKENKHHSVFGHDYISLYFEGIIHLKNLVDIQLCLVMKKKTNFIINVELDLNQ